MEENCEDLASVESRHKKEKKELQAQIQALKKSAKNDKSKKKELLTEIAHLESAMEIRHKVEIEVFRINDIEQQEVQDHCNEGPNIKISKAQKRRDKKLQQEKERKEQIKLQEKDNINGPRNLEIQSITAKLKDLKLKIYPIPSDGDCLYKAIEHQLQIKKQCILKTEELRKKAALYIKQNKADFMPFMSNHETYEMLTDEQFDDYCNSIATTKTWGGQLEIRALSNDLQCPITVIQASGNGVIEQGTEYDGAPLIISYHRHMYSLGEHYNSTCVMESEEEND